MDPIHKETAETLLRKLIELNDPRYIPAGYILAVMLERKRVLKVKEQVIRDGQRVFIYEQPKTGDVFTITDPNLRLDQLEQVQRDVAALLEHGLNPPPQPEPAAAEAAPVEAAETSAPPTAESAEPPTPNPLRRSPDSAFLRPNDRPHVRLSPNTKTSKTDSATLSATRPCCGWR